MKKDKLIRLGSIVGFVVLLMCSFVWSQAITPPGGGAPTTDASLLTSGTLNAARLPVLVNRVNDRGSSTTTAACDWTLGTICAFTPTNSVVVTLTNPTNGQCYKLLCRAGGTNCSGASISPNILGAGRTIGIAPNVQGASSWIIPFCYDGTNYYLDQSMDVLANTAEFSGPITSGFGTSTFITVTTTKGVGSVPAILSTFGVASGSEGLSGTQTDSTGACVAGATATSSGTTHCQIYSNGTNWVQTGR